MSEVPLYNPGMGPVPPFESGPLIPGHLWRDTWTALSGPYRGTSLIRNSLPLRPCSRTKPRALWRAYGGSLFLKSKVSLYEDTGTHPAGRRCLISDY